MTDQQANLDIRGLDGADQDAGEDPGLVVTAVAGIAAVGVSMAARPILKGIYRQITGTNPPLAEDPHVPFARALVWTVFTATTGAVLELVVQRVTRRMLDR